MKALDVPLVMPDGRQFDGAQLIDLERSLAALNVPRIAREALVARPASATTPSDGLGRQGGP
jgi:hypothetical protein